MTDSKQKEIFEELASNSMKEIWNLSKQTDFNDLTYKYNNFIAFKGPLGFFKKYKGRLCNTRRNRRRTKII